MSETIPFRQNQDSELLTAPSVSYESLEGNVETITFHSPETGFCVLKVRAKQHKNLVTLVGSLPVVTAGGHIEALGEWLHDRRFGLQFKAKELVISPPNTTESIEKYLSSGLIKGVGLSTAQKLTKKFGKKIFDVIENNPELLKTVPGIRPTIIEKIIESWEDQKIIHKIIIFLHDHDIGTNRAIRIYKQYGAQAIDIIQDNPYRLSRDIRGIGFLTADKVAEKLGIPRDSLIRARAGLSYALQKAEEEGHCGLPIGELLHITSDLLDITDESLLRHALGCELEANHVIKESIDDIPCIFLRYLFEAEKGVAFHIKRLLKAPLPFSAFDLDKHISWVEGLNDITLSLSQRQALKNSLTHKISIITGGPGVGKTTLLQSIVEILRTKELKFALCAPTGRAAKRMTEATGIEAKTIHRLLNINPESGSFSSNEYDPIKGEVVIVDEVSMVDVGIMHALLKAIPPTALLIFVGDKDQLPSVGPGQVLADFIASGAIPFVHLTETFRQAATSNIIRIAQDVNKGQMPPLKGFGQTSDFYFLEIPEAETALQTIIDLVKTRLPQKYGVDIYQGLQVLSPMTRGILGTKNLNIELQKAINPPSKNSLLKYGSSYSVGDKVIQIENNYEKDIYNGDLGTIVRINSEDNSFLIQFDDREISYDINEMDEINLAYAMTIHKSQGSEYPIVLIPLIMQHYPMLKKNLVYTGITRGKRIVVMVGHPKALEVAINSQNTSRRWSLLKKRLQESD